ncbi:hypothetical protein GF378_02565 [Candidatus Pacearchaeota archaeon]|nr:hypothetical protein [Candidatus Pacearchaeota archaeon]
MKIDIEKARREIYDYYELIGLKVDPDLPSVDKEFPDFKLEEDDIFWKRDIYNIPDIEGMSYFKGKLMGKERRVVNGQKFDILMASNDEGIRNFEEYSNLLFKPFLISSRNIILLDKYNGLPETERQIQRYTDLGSRLLNARKK